MMRAPTPYWQKAPATDTGSVSVQFVLSVVNAENTMALDASILGIEFDTLQATALTESTHKATITGSLTAGTDYLLSIVDTASVITSVMTIADDGTIAISGKVGVGDAGEYKILAIGINGYTGTVEQSFQMTVAQYPLSTVEGFSVTANDVEMTARMAKSYSNFIAISTSTLIPGTDYDLEIQGLGQTTSLTITDNFNGTATITAPDTLSMSDAGSYSIKAVGKNNYTGEISSGDFNVQINPRDIASIENFTFSADTTNVYALTAKSYSDVVSVGAGLVPSTDYTLSISNRPSGSNPSVLYVNNDGSITASKDILAEDMGEYTITLTARNNYSGTLDTQLVIILEHLDFTTIDGYALVSKNIELSALTAAYYVNVISIGNTGLRPGVDYSMAITSRPAGANSDAISIDNSGTLRATAALATGDAGTYTVEVTGLGNYTGSASVDFVLTVNTIALDASILGIEFDTLQATALTESTHKATITGSLTAGTDYLLSIVDTASVITSVMTIADDGTIAISGKVGVGDAGEYKILAIGINNYTGTVEQSFQMTVAQYPLSTVEGFSVTANDVEMTARMAKSYSNFIAISTSTLIPGTDYDLEIQGLGQTTSLTITDNFNGTATITAPDTLSMSDAGSYSIKAVGKNNYTGEISSGNFNVQINPRDIASIENFTFSADTTNVYALTAKSYSDVVSVGAGLVPSTDYTLSISNRPSGSNPSVLYVNNDGSITASKDISAEDMGEYTITLTARNNYSGTLDTQLVIILEQLDFTTIDGYALVSKNIELSALTAAYYVNVISIGNTGLRPGVDYSMAITSRPAGANSDAISIDNSGTLRATAALATGDAGTYTVEVTGLGNYTGSASVDFVLTVNTIALDASILGIEFDTLQATALTESTHKATITGSLTAGTDYLLSIVDTASVITSVMTIADDGTIAISGKVGVGDAGEYKILAIGINNYTGTVEQSFQMTVAQYPLSTVEGFSVTANDVEMTARMAKSYSNFIAISTSTLIPGVDYSMAITSRPAGANSDAISIDNSGTLRATAALATGDAGTYTVEVTGLGNYTGSASVDFVLTVNTIALDASILGIEFDTLQATALTESTHKATITGSLTAGTDYLLSIVDTASVITSVMTIADDGTIAISGKVGVGDAGEYKILAIGINNYTGTVEQSFQMTVAQYPLSTVEGFSVTANDVEMTARMAKSYSNFITISTSTLIPGTDYDLEIQGLGQTTSLTITDNFNGTATITAPDTLSMSDAGSYSIKAVGKNNYTGEISSGDFNVQINPRDIASIENFTFSADTTNVYALTAKSYSDVVSVGAGLVPSTDYTLSISNRPSGSNPSVLYVNNDGSITASKDISAEDMGEYTITLTARNNYSGTLDTQLVIILEQLDFTTIDGYALVSKNIELSALTAAYYVNVISIGNTGLRPGVDYSMAITSRPAGANSDAISIDNSGTLRATAALVAGDAGTYTVEITGLGNYTGSASVDFVLTVN